MIIPGLLFGACIGMASSSQLFSQRRNSQYSSRRNSRVSGSVMSGTAPRRSLVATAPSGANKPDNTNSLVTADNERTLNKSKTDLGLALPDDELVFIIEVKQTLFSRLVLVFSFFSVQFFQSLFTTLFNSMCHEPRE